MKKTTNLLSLAALALLASCATKPKDAQAPASQVSNLNFRSFTPLADDQRPIIMVVVEDAAAPGANEQVVRHDFTLFGKGVEPGSAQRPTAKQVETRVITALNYTKRLRVASVGTIRRYQQMVKEGIMEASSPDLRLTKPDYELVVTIQECADVTSKSKGATFGGFVSTSKGERVSIVKLHFRVTPMRAGTPLTTSFEGEAEGIQTSVQKGKTWNAPFVDGDSSSSATPTMDEAIKKCVYDLTTKFVDSVVPEPALEADQKGVSAPDSPTSRPSGSAPKQP